MDTEEAKSKKTASFLLILSLFMHTISNLFIIRSGQVFVGLLRHLVLTCKCNKLIVVSSKENKVSVLFEMICLKGERECM